MRIPAERSWVRSLGGLSWWFWLWVCHEGADVGHAVSPEARLGLEPRFQAGFVLQPQAGGLSSLPAGLSAGCWVSFWRASPHPKASAPQGGVRRKSRAFPAAFWVVFVYLFVLFCLFGYPRILRKLLGQGSNSSHSHDNAGSLISCATRELLHPCLGCPAVSSCATASFTSVDECRPSSVHSWGGELPSASSREAFPRACPRGRPAAHSALAVYGV